MSHDLHPYRFYAAGKAAAGRKDAARDKTRMEDLAENTKGRIRLVHHVRGLIRDWVRAREVMFDMEPLLEEYAGVESIEVEGGQKIVLPIDLFYVHFGSRAELYLEGGDAFIDGMYVQERILDGKIGMEFIYVCNEPAWDRFDEIGEKMLLNTAGRAVRACSPYRGRIERGIRQTGYLGCVAMIGNEAFGRAIQRTLLCLKNICAPESAPAPTLTGAVR
jgi:hypothetical protein